MPDGNTDVNLFRVLLQAKYYFNTFMSPHLIVGTGSYWRTDTISGNTGNLANATQSQNALGFNAGAGLEFQLKPSKAYIQLEAVIHDVSFGDDNDPKFTAIGIPDRSGLWVVAEAALVFAW